MAQNQAQRKLYSWTETTEVTLKGGGGKKPLRAKIAANKAENLKEYLDGVDSLVGRYIPPDLQSLQAAFQAGKAGLDKSSGELVFNDYVKPGDTLTLVFDTAAKKVRSFAVATYLDEPKDAVTLNARFSSLADGTNFLEESVLFAKAKEIRIRTTNFGHRKSGG